MTRPLLLAGIALCAAQAGAPPQIIRSSVEAVRVPVWVTDGSRTLRDLRADDFVLLDKGVEQTVRLVPLDGQDVDVTLVLDVSGSVQGRALDQLRGDVNAIADALQPNDRVRLIAFGENVTDVFGFRPGGAELPIEHMSSGGVTSFYAALAAALITDPANDRPQLVFALTDGVDNASFLDAGRVTSIATLSSASLYIALVDPSEPAQRFATGADPLASERSTLTYTPNSGSVYERHPVVTRSSGPYVLGPNLPALKTMVARTGGALYTKASGTLVTRFQRALDDFRAGYLLSYSPAGVPPGGWHDIAVRTKNPKYTVRARGGYDGGT